MERHSPLRPAWHVVGGRKMHSLAAPGPPGSPAPPVVLVHGLGLSGRYMVPTGEELAGRYPVHIPDLPGFGDSDKPRRVLDVRGLADALGDWMETAGITGAALLGNSFGCQIIADLAARRPGLAARCILQGPTSAPEDRGWLRQYVIWRRNAPYNPPELDPIAWGDYRKAGYYRVLRTFHHSIADAIEDKLPHMPQPTLVVRGERDPICRDG